MLPFWYNGVVEKPTYHGGFMPCPLYHRMMQIRKTCLTVFRDFSLSTGSAPFSRNVTVLKKKGYPLFLFSDISLATYL